MHPQPRRHVRSAAILFVSTCAFLLAAATSAARADAPCWRPVDKGGADPSLSRPEFSELLRAVVSIEQLLMEHPVLRDLPETRGRIWRSSGAPPQTPRPHAAAVHTARYWREAWVAGPCGIHPQAERIPLSHALRISAWLNEYEFLLRAALSQDGRSVVFEQPDVLGTLGRYRFYGYQDALRRRGATLATTGYLVMTAEGSLPWIPISTGEYLDLLEAQWRQAKDRRERDRPPPSDDAQVDRQVQATYESLRKLDPAAAEKYRESMRAQLAKQRDPQSRMNRRMAAGADKTARIEREEEEQFAAARRQLAGRLDGQAHMGRGPAGFPRGLATAADRGAIPLVKLDPQFWDRASPGRVQTIVFQFGGRATPGEMERAMQGLDLERAAGLLR